MPKQRRWLLAWLLPLSACGSTGQLAGAPPHSATSLVTVTGEGLKPSGRVRIPAFATVVFKNGLERDDVVVRVACNFAESEHCATSLRFHCDGGAAVSDPIPPQAIAARCYHEAGSYPFSVRTPAGELNGTVEVGAGR